MTQRALSVLVLASAALIVYFVIRTVRLRRQNRKTRRYGVLDTNIENMELTPLEQDDDDDTTLFDASHPQRLHFEEEGKFVEVFYCGSVLFHGTTDDGVPNR
ncbi:Membrane protein [Turdus rufiventris]|nr:Membrane protein [Turdus rufiventris]